MVHRSDEYRVRVPQRVFLPPVQHSLQSWRAPVRDSVLVAIPTHLHRQVQLLRVRLLLLGLVLVLGLVLGLV